MALLVAMVMSSALLGAHQSIAAPDLPSLAHAGFFHDSASISCWCRLLADARVLLSMGTAFATAMPSFHPRSSRGMSRTIRFVVCHRYTRLSWARDRCDSRPRCCVLATPVDTDTCRCSNHAPCGWIATLTTPQRAAGVWCKAS